MSSSTWPAGIRAIQCSRCQSSRPSATAASRRRATAPPSGCTALRTSSGGKVPALTDDLDRDWRDPAAVVGGWRDSPPADPQLLRARVRGRWWELLEQLGVCLLVSREYEHLLVALSVEDGRPHVSYLPLPHPSGIAVDRTPGRERVFVASTRNPNQVDEFLPTTGVLPRLDVAASAGRPVLVPVASTFYPGALYLHDLAFVGGRLHGNAVGQNTVVRLEPRGQTERVWWPRCIETDGEPEFGRNHIQLNSIAAGPSIAGSFFSASTDEI